jgi:hypothetical protein
MAPTPDERAAMAQRAAAIKARMDAMWPNLNSETVMEWARLYQEHDELEQQLRVDDPSA